MREIKFRGKRVDNGEWIYGSLIIEPNMAEFKSIHSDLRNLGKSKYLIYPFDATQGRAIEVIPESVGEYTGKKDKNGKEIYEGDIVEASYPPTYTERIYDIRYIHDGFCCFRNIENKKIIFEQLSIRGNESIEVIGNIYEDKELLNK